MNSLRTSNNFDVIRLILAMLVFFAHWNILTGQNISFFLFHLSDVAVDLFFIVSGFLIFWSFDKDSNIKHFYLKRFFRIYPLYSLLILLQAIFFIIFSNGSLLENVRYILVNMFFMNFLEPSVGDVFNNLEVNAINGSLWTLKNEIAFYSIVPFLYKYFKKWGRSFLLTMYLSSVMFMLIMEHMGFEKMFVQFPSQLRLFLVGIWLYIDFNKLNKRSIILFSLMGLILVLILKENMFFKFSFYPLLMGIILFFTAYGIKIFKITFDFSFSFYILHFPIIQLFLYLGIHPSNSIISFTTLFSFVFFLSYYSERYIEKRFINLGKRLLIRTNGSNKETVFE